jgi:hypothetical protein
MRLMLVLIPCLLAAETATVFFSKHFPGSLPEYFEITLSQDGKAVYKEAPNDEEPVEFQLAPEAAASIFELAAKVDHFSRPLESKLKVANTGEKTLRYSSGSTKNEAKFNYSLDPNAKLLQEWFERIGETQRLLLRLEYTTRFDKLGVNQVLMQMESAANHNRLVAGPHLLPLLDKVAGDASFMNIARKRAAMLADIVRAPRTVSR